jgi:asparagine synthase (glutamine-hydrolysing)
MESSAAPAPNNWVLDLALESPIETRRAGGPFTAHYGLQTFFDGILHDRDELLASLGLSSSTSNAALIAAGYAASGRSFFARLRGAFVAAVVDMSEWRATVVRDPLGSYPLYYAIVGRRALFATDPHTLLSQPGVSRDLNRTALADRLCSRWPAPTETYFAAINRVPPGSFATIDKAALVVTRYWDPVPGDRPVSWLSSTEPFEDTLERAVRRCLDTGRAGVFLSGGLDSISIAAVAADLTARANRPSPLALSLGFPDPGCDERLVQTSVARQLGLPHQLLDFHAAVGGGGLLTKTLRLNERLASPVLNTWAPAYFTLTRAGAAAGVRTVLTGSGGDEWLSVSPYLAADLWRRGDAIGLARFAAAWHRSYRPSWRGTAQSLVWQYGLRPLASMLLHRIAPETWGARRARRLTRDDPHWVAPDPLLLASQRRAAPRTLADPDPRHGFYLQDVRTGLDHSISSLEMEEQFQFGRQLGVRFMHPYWDADLVDMLYRIPPHLLMATGRSKAMVRELLARRFPSLGFERQRKVVATSFLRGLLQNEGPHALGLYGAFRTLGGLGVVDPRKAGQFASAAFKDAGSSMYRAWELLNVESWAQAHTA